MYGSLPNNKPQLKRRDSACSRRTRALSDGMLSTCTTGHLLGELELCSSSRPTFTEREPSLISNSSSMGFDHEDDDTERSFAVEERKKALLDPLGSLDADIDNCKPTRDIHESEESMKPKDLINDCGFLNTSNRISNKHYFEESRTSSDPPGNLSNDAFQDGDRRLPMNQIAPSKVREGRTKASDPPGGILQAFQGNNDCERWILKKAPKRSAVARFKALDPDCELPSTGKADVTNLSQFCDNTPGNATMYNDVLKVILVSAPDSDKRCLVQRLVGKEPTVSKRRCRQSKLSLDVEEWRPDTDCPFQFRIWNVHSNSTDFDVGQLGTHHATQSLFFSPNSLYVHLGIWDPKALIRLSTLMHLTISRRLIAL